MNQPTRVSILIPAYNAAGTLESVIQRLPWAFGAHVLIVNDGSSDETQRTIEQIRQSRRDVDCLVFLHNQGYARVQKAGIDALLRSPARPDVVVLLHADGQYPPEWIPTLIAPIVQGKAECVLGSRMRPGFGSALAGGMPIYKAVGNRVLTCLENQVFGLRFTEYHSGFIAYSRRALEAIPYRALSNSFHFDAEMLVMASKLGFSVAEIGIPTHYGTEKSHLRPMPYLRSILKVLWREWRGVYDALAEQRSA